MSELSGVLDVAANNETDVFSLSAETQSLLLYALDQVANYKRWVKTPLDELTDTDKAQIDDLIENATYEVMHVAEINIIGEIRMFGGGAVPAKWFTCTGDAISRATYSDLFDVIGTFFGAGNGTTTFNLPDFRDKIPMGVLGSVTTDVGDTAGALTHTLTTAELPIHNHGVTDPGHIHSVTDPGHVHGINTQTGGAAGANNVIVAGVANVNTTPVVKNSNSNTTGISVQSHATGLTVNNAGSGDAHSILNPVLGCHFMIYTGVP